ncbi:D-2-hydroxyacid dehydrogenase family protein [Polynucleobacter kasalickyi]|uniref:D-3-phosphoglycerate dehydrogenase n=1 Tax=Polynucleobacter kasalickyi TaxID=1938817 RepID=A0A1W1Y238_9BURK|nr:D-2-hydroxyacid dehydrogenase family protein [Polynucleobacter kasalickyi]SMC30207.1 D-3-phosphoglycerate dehydrogenase [Polynucleobacter kasalickyi]
MKIIIPEDYQDCVRHLHCFSMLKDHEVVILNQPLKNLEERVAALSSADALVLIRERTRMTKELIERLPNLKLISQVGKANAHIDLAACKAAGIAIGEGEGSGAATAELTIALILAAKRNIVSEVNRLQSGQWQGSIGEQIRGKTVGILGLGKIGTQVAKILDAFGAHILVWGREGSLQQAATLGYESAKSREEFFSRSDILTVHIRSNPQTRGMIKASDLALMKPTSLFVNTSRAELIEPGALVTALQNNRPGFAAIDVYEQELEPVLDAQHPLLHLPNTLCTPHLGYVEKDNYEAYLGTAFENIIKFVNGQTSHLKDLSTF